MALLRRRQILTATAAYIAAPGVLAQSKSRPRVALLFGGRQADSANFVNALLGEMRVLGYQDGRTVDDRRPVRRLLNRPTQSGSPSRSPSASPR